jgi:hypothetical protein
MYSIYKFSHYIFKLNILNLNIVKNIFDFKLIFTGFEQLNNTFNDKNNDKVLNQIQSKLYTNMFQEIFVFKIKFQRRKKITLIAIRFDCTNSEMNEQK